MDTSDLLNRSQTSSIINLDSLLDLSARLNETDDETFILNSALLSLMGKLRILRSCVITNNSGDLEVTIFKGKEPIFESLPDLNYIVEFPTMIEAIATNAGYEYVFCIEYKNKVFAYIFLASSLTSRHLTDEENRYAQMVCRITGNALANARSHHNLTKEIQKTEKHNQLLTTLFEVTYDFSTLLSKEQILKMLSYHLMGQLMVNKFAVLQLISDNKFISLINRFDDSLAGDIVVLDCDNIITTYIERQDNPWIIKRYFPKAIVVSPMIVQGKTKGLLLVGKSMSGKPFDDMNLHFLSALGNTAMYSLENDRLFQEELGKKAIENELMFALEIQKNLLPNEIPQYPLYNFYGSSVPSRHVGGDYFDFVKLPNNRVLIAIADVSGKGMPAALIMANVQAALRVLSPLDITMLELIEKINTLIYNNTTADRFITFFVGILNTETHEFHYINAGHNPPFHYVAHDNCIKELKEGGLILGCLEVPPPYSEGKITLASGDRLVLYTDGITEAMNASLVEFGEQRAKNILLDNSRISADEIGSIILNEVAAHSADYHQYDDQTLIVVARD